MVRQGISRESVLDPGKVLEFKHLGLQHRQLEEEDILIKGVRSRAEVAISLAEVVISLVGEALSQ